MNGTGCRSRPRTSMHVSAASRQRHAHMAEKKQVHIEMILECPLYLTSVPQIREEQFTSVWWVCKR